MFSKSSQVCPYKRLITCNEIMPPKRRVTTVIVTKPETIDPKHLPKLPVPNLKVTLNKYLLSVRPLLNDQEFEKTVAICKDFEIGVGQVLQDILKKRAHHMENWLEEWWMNTAYLEFRKPVTVFSSPGLVLPHQSFKNRGEQLEYAAHLLLGAVEYKSLIDDNKIALEMMGRNPLDMGQYKKVFGTNRVPWEKRDKLSFNRSSGHVTVIHNNRFFHLDVFGGDKRVLNDTQLIQQLNRITEISSQPDAKGIGYLTTEHRDTWAKAYQLLSADETNRINLADIETSMLILCLDAPCGLSKNSNLQARANLAGEQTIHGQGSKSNGGNRWFDKTIQMIVGADGVNGLTYEHSPAEGQPVAIMSDYMVEFIIHKKGFGYSAAADPREPKELTFVISSQVENMINEAKQNLDKLAKGLDLKCFKFTEYGKFFIKSQKLSPDSYLQMAMQLAFYRLHNQPGAHYESASTRMYKGGRTETIRSCSIESVAFAKTMLSNQSNKEKMDAMKTAINAHKKFTVMALFGLGVDRHLLGLKRASLENNIALHELFTDKGFKKSTHMRIATSQVALKTDGFMCYGPIVNDGYAVCYNPRENDMNFATAAFSENSDTDCAKFKAALEQSLHDMHNVIVKKAA